MEERFIESTLKQKDTTFELPLRPKNLDDFTGQATICERLKILIGAAKQRNEALSHCIFCGPPGLGKTTLANILANEMGSQIVVTSGAVIEKAGDLAGLLTNLNEGDILFIDEIHRLSRQVEEYLYPAMEDFALDLMIDSGPNARSVQVKLNRFTLVGATTKMGLLTGPLRTRFGFHCRLDFYSVDILKTIIKRNAYILGLQIDDQAAEEIAKRGRGTPRITNNLLRWVRDFTQVHGKTEHISKQMVVKALNMLAIDEKGLDEMDKKILEVIIDYHSGGPVGLNTIATAIGEEATTIEEVYEPYLIMQGFLKRTSRGRIVTDLGYKHMGFDKKENKQITF